MTTPRPQPQINLPAPSPLAQHFALDPTIAYLNHGSFGACPKPVLGAQRGYRDRIEGDAMRFYIHDLWPMIDRSRQALGELVHANPRDIVFLPNATTAVATVAANLKLEPGDELLATGFEYPACINNLRRAADRAGASLVTAHIPWPLVDRDAVVDAVMSRVTARTRLVLVSLITSATGVRLPVERLIAELSARGIDTLLDAAHGPGCVAMNLTRWAAAYTTGNAHKWLCSPKGAAFLHVRSDLQDGFRPLVLSNDAMDPAGAGARTGRSAFNHEFDYAGTDDRTPILSIPDAIGFLGGLMPGGIDAMMTHNRELCLLARDMLCNELGTEALVADSMLGPLAVIGIDAPNTDARVLRQRLFDRHRIETMIVSDPARGTPMVRVSPHAYNTIEQYAYLAEAIKGEIGRG